MLWEISVDIKTKLKAEQPENQGWFRQSEGGAEIFLVSITKASQLMLFWESYETHNCTMCIYVFRMIIRLNSDFPLYGEKMFTSL
jgi:hypothetical protein